MSNSAKKILSTASIIQDICKIVTEITGVQLGDRQSAMVQSRLKKRLTELQLETEQDYFEFFLENRDSETKALVSLLTTHHTYFFRESSHFDYMIDSAIPALIAQVRKRPDRILHIWSAACSKGQEVYSIAMLLAAHMPRIAPDINYRIFGTDIDDESVQIAANGVYQYNEIKKIPISLADGHWIRGTGEISNFVKAKNSLKEHCSFATANLLNFDSVTMPPFFDIIFCRNVFIYFTSDQIKDVSSRLLKKLSPGGVFFIGLSESLNGMNLPINVLGPSIYQLKTHATSTPKSIDLRDSNNSKRNDPAPTAFVATNNPTPVPMPNPLKVLCVDDSASVIMLLKQILKCDQGFEVVATASNGIEAAKALKEKPFDVMTLDIHMPEQNGLEYLKKNYGRDHPPVIMVSSASREDGDLAIGCLEAGASDFVEKPSLHNMAESGEEICNKLRSAWQNRTQKIAKKSNLSMLDKSFATTIAVRNPEKHIRIVVAGFADQKKLIELLKNLKGIQPPTLILIDGSENTIPAFAKSISTHIALPITLVDGSTEAMLPGTIKMGSLRTSFDEMKTSYHVRRTTFLVYGSVGKTVKARLRQWTGAHVIVEDLGNSTTNDLADIADEIVPHTSFVYLSIQFMSRFYD